MGASHEPAGLPAVSVIVPVYNEVDYIDDCLESLLSQEYAGAFEVVIADGGSSDGTCSLLEDWEASDPRVRVIDNPGRVQALGLNAAAAVARGDIIVRADAHSTYALDYVRRSVRHLLDRKDLAVGGPHRAVGHTPIEQAIAGAMTSPWALGPSAFRFAQSPQSADSLYLGAMWKSRFHELGGFRALQSGVAEDADFYHRWRAAGGAILVDPSIRSWYRPRPTYMGLVRQYWRYGRGKAEFFYLHGRFPTWRPFAPGLLVLAMLSAGGISLVTASVWPLMVVLGSWVVALVFAGWRIAGLWLQFLRVVLVVGAMHLTYGLGLLHGFLTLRGGTSKLARERSLVQRSSDGR